VQHYTIRISFDRENKTISGDTIVLLKPLQNNFNRIELDAADIKFESVKLESEKKEIPFKLSDEKIYLTLDKNYSPADLIAVRFKYSAKPSKGVYFVRKDSGNQGINHPAQIWTQGEPEEARHWFPSYDFPDDKATSEQFITVEKGETAIGNGESLGVIENDDGTKTFHFKMPVPHSTYLTSFVVGTYKKISDSYKNIPLGFYTYPGKESVAQRSNSQTKEMMRVFEELTGINYPFNKYDQTVVANFTFGGMENITATTMSDTEMFLNRPNDVEDLISHELAHSWFGNLVTCRNWAELWLNEGFATYMEAAYREKKYGRNDYLRKLREDLEVFTANDAVNQNRHGLYNTLARPDDSIFDPTNYQKGGLVIHTLRETVGTENFWKALNIYLNRHKFQNVETIDLQNVMEEVSKTDLDWFFDQWVYGAGYPKLRIEQFYNQPAKRLELIVEQTQAADKITPEAFVLPMEVEITLENGDKKTEKIEIKKREETFSIKLDGEPKKIVFDKMKNSAQSYEDSIFEKKEVGKSKPK
jgi:aminopeptidase N